MRTRIRTLAVAVALALCWWCCLGGAPALAHTELESSAPEQGAVLAAAPKEVRLTFSEDLGGGSLAVTADGRSVGADAARVDGADLVLGIAPGAPAGAWTVAYRVVSADGHPVTGQFAFTVEAARASSTPPPSDTPSPSASPAAGSASTDTATPMSGQHTMDTAGRHGSMNVTAEVAVTLLALAALVVGVFRPRRRR